MCNLIVVEQGTIMNYKNYSKILNIQIYLQFKIFSIKLLLFPVRKTSLAHYLSSILSTKTTSNQKCL
jgi:hypothetical protein